MVDTVADLEFPVWGLLPKQETGITSFLNKYPEYDGRNIRIAIFDSGVDPGAPGLQRTSTGATKVIERYDCSGCGDVNTSTIVKVNEAGFIKGLTGRLLKIPTTWANVNDGYRIGVKNAFELYPSKLKERIELERKEKLWDEQHKIVLADAARDIQTFEASIKKGNQPGALTEADALTKEDYDSKLEFLNNAEKKYHDLGPVYDCVLFYDGTVWKACIDTSEEGDLENGVLLGEYSKTHEFAPLTKSDQLNISINVHDDGNVLEIVGLCSGHGTHVASIASAYFPDHPEKNGAAPGAQIISLTIGDGRLGSMETGTGLVRAMIKIMELHQNNTPVQVINMSYGEHANWSNAGRIGELMNEVVNKYGVVWVVSAGNHGPALCTVGTPPDISQSTLIGVGAYVSPEMMVAEYSMRQKLPGMTYTWTSRGPTIDGNLGVSVCAPGGAITSVPNFTLRNAQLLNGTSMAAPHVAGAVGVLLSGLNQRKLPYSPYNVKRALENTASFLENVDPFAQGYGLLKVDKAFENLVNYHNCAARNVRFAISCDSNNSKGIHIRTGVLKEPLEYTINIEPTFKDDDAIDPEVKINFGIHCALVCKASYVQCPAFLDVQNLVRTISIKITPDLPSGVHYTSIQGYDVNCVDKGALFTIPITIIQPIEFESNSTMELNWKDVKFEPNTIKRNFIKVPDYATWGILRMRITEQGKQGRFVVHCMQIRPKQSCKSQEFQKMYQVTSLQDATVAFQIKGGLILEVVVAKYWASIGEVNLNYSILFHGIKPETSFVTMQASDGLQNIELRCLRSEEIAPVITIKSQVQILKPTETKLSPLTKRDIIPIGRQIYELVLSYEFHVSKSTEVVPNSPILSEVLYESEFESQLWMLFDSNKQLLSAGDAYSCKYNVKLERGDYMIKLHIRHDKKDLLEKVNDIPLLLNRKLANTFTIDVYGNYIHAITQAKKVVSICGRVGTTIPIYISPFLTDKAKPASITGHYYLGTISYAKDEIGKKVDTYSFKYIPIEATKKPATKSEREMKSKLEEYNDALRDLKTNHLAKLDIAEIAEVLYDELKEAYPEHINIYTSMMQHLDSMETKKQLPVLDNNEVDGPTRANLMKLISISDILIKMIDMDKLLALSAVKHDIRQDAIKTKTNIEKQKTALLDALTRKGIALSRIYLATKNDSSNTDIFNNIKNIWKEVLKLVDPNDTKVTAVNVFHFGIWHAFTHNQYGRILKYLLRIHEEKPLKEFEEKMADVCGYLKWQHLERYIKKSILVKYPSSYRLF